MGPTASGKSNWAIKQAVKYKAAIINCDSIQVYKELDIGSSKPSLQERSLVPHYLFDYVSYPAEMTAGQYTRDFFSILEQIKEDLIFVVGGTGFYFQALELGMYPVKIIPEEVKARIAQELQKKTFAQIYEWITERDPIYANKISVNDKYRIERAYELMVSENKTMTQIQEDFDKAKKVFPYKYLKIGISGSREDLLKLVEKRTAQMIDNGLIDEVKMLINKGYSSWAPLSSVGYKEVVIYLNENRSKEWLAEEINKNTMKLIKKQKTWFQRDKQIININKEQESLSELDSFVGDSGY